MPRVSMMATNNMRVRLNQINPLELVTVLFLTTLILTIICDWLHLSGEVTKWLMAIGNNFSGAITTLIQLTRGGIHNEQDGPIQGGNSNSAGGPNNGGSVPIGDSGDPFSPHPSPGRPSG